MRPRSLRNVALRIAASLLVCLGTAQAANWILPTANRALFTGDYDDFFMYVPRRWEGKDYTVWQGGQYGFVRTPVKSKGKIIYAKFHEGLDIKPTRRDSRGDPLEKKSHLTNSTFGFRQHTGKR